jgi:hypothetical protein
LLILFLVKEIGKTGELETLARTCVERVELQKRC